MVQTRRATAVQKEPIAKLSRAQRTLNARVASMAAKNTRKIVKEAVAARAKDAGKIRLCKLLPLLYLDSATSFVKNAIVEKNPGNEAYKKKDFAAAHQHYDKAIELDPASIVYLKNKAVKAYIRKGSALQGLHKHPQAMKAYRSALNVDGNNQEAMEGIRACISKNEYAPAKQALEDPELQKVLSDPVIKVVLEQMQQDPKASQKHLKNPDTCEKFMKLVDAGIVRLG